MDDDFLWRYINHRRDAWRKAVVPEVFLPKWTSPWFDGGEPSAEIVWLGGYAYHLLCERAKEVVDRACTP